MNFAMLKSFIKMCKAYNQVHVMFALFHYLS